MKRYKTELSPWSSICFSLFYSIIIISLILYFNLLKSCLAIVLPLVLVLVMPVAATALAALPANNWSTTADAVEAVLLVVTTAVKTVLAVVVVPTRKHHNVDGAALFIYLFLFMRTF